jgi:V/A-type H+-transporting ATPase subunit E
MSQEKMDNALIDKTIDMRGRILGEAEKKATWILTKAEEEKKRIMEQTHKSIEGVIGSELRAVHDRIVGRAQLEGRRQLLEARMEVLNRVYDEALEQIKAVAAGKRRSVDYSGSLIKLIAEADQAMGDDMYLVSANAKDLVYLKKSVGAISEAIGGKKITIKETPVDIIGGIIVSNPDGTKSMENTLERRLGVVNDRLQTEIAKKLGVI